MATCMTTQRQQNEERHRRGFAGVQELEMILSAFNNWGIHDGTPVLISEQMGRTHS
jgi:hypothetical protein